MRMVRVPSMGTCVDLLSVLKNIRDSWLRNDRYQIVVGRLMRNTRSSNQFHVDVKGR